MKLVKIGSSAGNLQFVILMNNNGKVMYKCIIYKIIIIKLHYLYYIIYTFIIYYLLI